MSRLCQTRTRTAFRETNEAALFEARTTIGSTEWLFRAQRRQLRMHVGYIWTAWAIVGSVMALESTIAPWWAWLLWLFVIALLVPWK